MVKVCVFLIDAANFEDEVLTTAALLELMERLLDFEKFHAIFLICANQKKESKAVNTAQFSSADCSVCLRKRPSRRYLRVSTNRENQEYSGIFHSLEKLREFLLLSGKISRGVRMFKICEY